MSYIKEVPYDEAEGDLKEAYDDMMAGFGGRLPAVLSVMSLSPASMRGVHALSKAVSFGGSTLGRRREEMIATYVSTLNHCHY